MTRLNKNHTLASFFCALFALTVSCGQPQSSSDLKRVYRDVTPGTYQSTFTLADCQNETLLSFMKKKIYPALATESANQSPGWRHINAVKDGEGVELRLTEGITTFHVKYKKHGEERAERSGRSFSAVGLQADGSYEYVADASYAHYFDSFERALDFDTDFLTDFNRAIFGIITHCDASAIAELNPFQQRLVADFVAVYIAEQYRHLLGGRGERLGRYHRWEAMVFFLDTTRQQADAITAAILADQ